MQSDEIKTIIVLSGATRLPDLEAEIFVSDELTTLYLHNLCKDYFWFVHGNHWGHTTAEINARGAYYYAYNVFGQRWLEAEPLIASMPIYAYYYARYVIKARWSEAESAIYACKNPDFLRQYAELFLSGE